MSRYFAVPNSIVTNKELTNSDVAVATYLFSLIRPSKRNSFGFCVKVKQETIAARCGISIKTVSRTVDKLLRYGIINKKIRTLKENRHLGTYIYILTRPQMYGTYFYCDRRIIKLLSRNTLRAYLLCCKCADIRRSFFQSYSELAKMLGVKRSEAIRIIKELVTNSIISVKKKLTKAGDYTDNHYCLLKKEHKKRNAPAIKNKDKSPTFKCIITCISDFVKCFFEKITKKLRLPYLFKGGGGKNVHSIFKIPTILATKK